MSNEVHGGSRRSPRSGSGTADGRPTPAAGPLVVSRTNPRYFAVGSDGAGEQPVYLTGSHVNNNFHDGLGAGKDCPQDPETFDYQAYLEFLRNHGHNFIRLWRWEQFTGYLPGADVHFCMQPQPWLRSGPGTARDGKPRFDLSTFDQSYFDRLRDRVVDAGNAGIYVSVMLFEGFSLHLTAVPDNIEGHPFHRANNVNDIGIASIVDYQVLPLDPQVRALQEAYIRHAVDTVHDLPNVLYEVANESSGLRADSVELPDGSTIETPIGDSTDWQYWVIDFVKEYEDEKGYDKHPVGMTFQYPVADQRTAYDTLWRSPADWISPGFDDGPTPADSRWLLDPPANDGTKVVISDTDHYSPFAADALWAWKSFLRGHNPILYDLGIVNGVDPPVPMSGAPSYESLEPARHAMGEARRFSELVGLGEMQPRGDLTPTGYALADPGVEYLVLQPDDGKASLDISLAPGTYRSRWHDVNGGETVDGEDITVDQPATLTLRHPFSGPTATAVHLTATS